jgi:hypothetical protein
MALISIHAPSSSRVSSFNTAYALQQDDWDDYGFKTTYHLYQNLLDGNVELVGSIKILRRG